MSNLQTFMDKYNLKPRDYGNHNIKCNVGSMRILESSILVDTINYYNDDILGLIEPNKATEILALGYFSQNRDNYTIHIPHSQGTYREFQCFITRFVFHGKIKNTNLLERDINNLIINRFAFKKTKFDVRLMDFSFSNFYVFSIGQAPTELVQFMLDNEEFKNIERFQLKQIAENPYIHEDLSDRLSVLLELTGG